MIKITLENYELIRGKYGHMASWAVYADKKKEKKEKSGVGETSFFETPNQLLLDLLNPNIILVGLNISQKIDQIFGNFHSASPSAQDYKIRFALKNSMFWGAYMTDIIKDFKQKISGDVMKYLHEHPVFEKENIDKFIQELKDIGATKPIIIAFGNDTYTILQRNLKDKYKIYKVTHYSAFITKEKLHTEFEELAKTLIHRVNVLPPPSVESPVAKGGARLRNTYKRKSKRRTTRRH